MYAKCSTLFVLCLIQSTFLLAQTPFACTSDFYQSLGDNLNYLNVGDSSYSPIGSPAVGKYNSIGYNVIDDYLYGIGRSSTIKNHLIRIDANGIVTPLTDLGGSSIAGDMDRNGNLWYTSSGGLTKVSVTSPYLKTVYNSMTNVPSDAPNDIVYIPSGGRDYFYGGEITSSGNAYIYKYDISAGNVETFPMTGLPSSGSFGAAWVDVNNNLYLGLNQNGEIYWVDGYDTGVPNAISLMVTQNTPSNDGASCPYNAPSFGVMLPVAWLDFTIEFEGEMSKLSWSTSRESQCDYFEVERSTDGNFFESIVQVSSIGVDSQAYQYHYVDQSVQLIETDRICYRIKQVDFDSRIAYSSVSEVSLERQGALSVETFPNPAMDNITFRMKASKASELTLSVFNPVGQVIEKQVIEYIRGVVSINIDTHKWINGIYYLHLTSQDNQNELRKFLVQQN